MSSYRNRVGQTIGSWTVESRAGTTRSGKVLWRLVEDGTGRERYLRTYEVIRLDRTELAQAPGSE